MAHWIWSIERFMAGTMMQRAMRYGRRFLVCRCMWAMVRPTCQVGLKIWNREEDTAMDEIIQYAAVLLQISLSTAAVIGVLKVRGRGATAPAGVK